MSKSLLVILLKVSTMRVNTTERLDRFRTALSGIQIDSKTLSAFIIYSGDAHNSEYPTKHDKRRDFISGFEGSAGTAVITTSKAALWTDGRYFVEAEETLDCNWILMKSGVAGTPSISTWLNEELQDGDYVGVDKTLVTHSSFTNTRDALLLLSKKLELIAIDSSLNPVDQAWGDDQPEQPNKTINALEMKFSGLRWQNKVDNLRANLTSKWAGAFVATALEDVAWLFNLRGTDVEYTPFFLAYAVVEMSRISKKKIVLKQQVNGKFYLLQK
ncbi:hypothetical protein Btru_056018 [Bulinus truncatus]|nr:hypothetical protein Btru_056018 [Bulinus truncatus]